ncbi:hypothetical protein TL16_g07573 [Triparma laevis f. inornata]|uniref:DOT1 domain-containing protein n=2 Tax=Triparma laevis TaxID=1534972 RepID=A0A9W7KUS6_9STRA|nr:hypothetical protein TL16_g07573 [Triparma laevis f. inornata]GMI12035.1 hypothetical protein TrLO_g9693 [Triparma laevis f. longispina]
MPVNAARTLSIALSSITPKCPSPVNHVTDLWTKLRASNLAHEASRSTFESRVPDSGPADSDPAESLAKSLAYEEYTRAYPTNSAFRSSVTSRLNGSPLHLQETTHGEIPFPSISHILSDLKTFGPKNPGNFVDLGSGVGQYVLITLINIPSFPYLTHQLLSPVISASLLDSTFSSCIGIELQKDANDEAISASNNLTDSTRIQFMNSNILSPTSLSTWSSTSTSVLLLHGHCFGPSLLSSISDSVIPLTPGSFIISTSAPLTSPYLQNLGSRTIKTSWGDCTIYYQQRVDQNSTLNPLSDDNTSDLSQTRYILKYIIPLLSEPSLRTSSILCLAFSSSSEESALKIHSLNGTSLILEILKSSEELRDKVRSCLGRSG